MPRAHLARSLPIVPAALFALLACGAPHPSVPAKDEEPRPADPPVERPGALPSTLPSTLQCASEALDTVTGTDVLRLHMTLGHTVVASASIGPQFLKHLDSWEPTPSSIELGALRVTLTDASVTLQSDKLALAVTRDGVFFGGVVALSSGERAELACWNDLEVFGSPWTLEAGGLVAGYQDGGCTDASGAPALNTLPLPFVRETGFAVCADLRGAALNGADFRYPDLAGFNLMGARLDAASLFFAQLTDAALQGARLDTFDYGYANITGHVDAHTVAPRQGSCALRRDTFGRETLSCMR